MTCMFSLVVDACVMPRSSGIKTKRAVKKKGTPETMLLPALRTAIKAHLAADPAQLSVCLVWSDLVWYGVVWSG